MTEAKSALSIRTELANQMMLDGNLEPGHLPNRHTINQIQYKNSVNLLKDKDPVSSLRQLMTEMPNIISDIGVVPVFVFYQLPLPFSLA